MKELILKKLRLPDYSENYDLDDPRITEMRRDIILNKTFLRKLYEEWYGEFVKRLEDAPAGKVIEIGSGAGFIKRFIPDAITSDVMPLSTNDMTFSAEDMPFADEELKGILMIDVLHHIPHPKLFFKEAERTLKKGGKIIMVEPANSSWGRYIYTHFHHEPFDPSAGWELPSNGPLSSANGAMPWIMLERDRSQFEKEFPLLQIKEIKYHTPLRYLLSGGVSMKSLVPGWSFGILKGLEGLINAFTKQFSMFQTIEIVKK